MLFLFLKFHIYYIHLYHIEYFLCTFYLKVSACTAFTFIPSFFTGFVNTRNFKIINTSLIPMTFHLRVPADGGQREEDNGHTDSLLDSNITSSGGTMMSQPKEFDITPCQGTIQPQDEMDIRVGNMFNSWSYCKNCQNCSQISGLTEVIIQNHFDLFDVVFSVIP